jgi:Astacin (Peptidase family M12A)
MPSAKIEHFHSYLCCAALLLAAPVPSSAQEAPASEKAFCAKPGGNYFQVDGNSIQYEIMDDWAVVEDDIIVGRSGDTSANYGATVSQKARTWDHGILPYKFDVGFPKEMRDLVYDALDHLDKQTDHVFTFTDVTDIGADQDAQYKDYVKFKKANFCDSWIGKKGGEQVINLTSECGDAEIIHEIGHALGLYHEHNRPDRNTYVIINWKNIDLKKKGARTAFCRIPRDRGEKKGAYDFDSIMHYSSRDFAREGTTTIDARKKTGKQVPSKHNRLLSAGDKKTLADLYGFPSLVSATIPLPQTDQSHKSCKVTTKQDFVRHPVFVHVDKNAVTVESAFAADSRVTALKKEKDPRHRWWYKIEVKNYLRAHVRHRRRELVTELVRRHGHLVHENNMKVGWIFESDYQRAVRCP